MFLSNWLIFKIVLAAVTGLVDYPVAADVLLVYDGVNKLYLDGNSLDYVSNIVLYKGETSYEIEGPNVIVGDEQKITSSDNTSGDQFGDSVSIDGDYAVCAASQDDTLRKGSAYIFKREGTTWTQQSKIVKDGTRSDYHQFGRSVAISGDYVISGMPGDSDTGGNNSGAAYIFKRYGTSWIQMQRIVGTTRTTNHRFGGCVSIDGEYAIVGMHYEGNFKGHASIFKRTGETWTEQIEVESDDGDTTDRFAGSVSISGNYAIVGAFNDNDNGSGSGSAYIYGLNGSTWSLQQKIIADDGVANDSFGWSVAISGEYALVGAYGHASKGCAYIFKRDGTSWTQQAKLISSDIEANDSFGQYVALKGDIAVISSPNEDPDNVSNAGSVYIFKRNGTKWIQQTKFTGNDSVTSDKFGTSVAVSNNDVIVGAYINESAYIYPLKEVTNYYITQPGTYRADLQICGIDYKTNEVEVTGSVTPFKQYLQTHKFTGSSVNNYRFGWATDVYGDYAIIGEYGYGSNSNGRAYIYYKSNGVWDLQATLDPSPAAEDNFGYSVAISSDYAVIGSRYDDDNGNAAGSVYLYKRTGTSWGDMQFIIAGTEYPFDIAQYGNSVAISGDYFIVGSEGDSPAGRSNYAGSAYIYQISSTQSATRSSEEYIVQSGSSGGEGYGSSVGISGDYAIVGPSNTTTPDIYIYKRTTGNTWTEHQKIQNIGVTVAINGDYVIIGNPTTRKAYIYILTNNTTWSQQAELTGAESVSGDRFGWSVSIHGEYAVVGASAVDTNTGAVYVFKRTGTSWSQYDRIQANDKAQNHYFAYNTNLLP